MTNEQQEEYDSLTKLTNESWIKSLIKGYEGFVDSAEDYHERKYYQRKLEQHKAMLIKESLRRA